MLLLSPFCTFELFAQISTADDPLEATQASLSQPQSGNDPPSATPPQLGTVRESGSQPLEEQPKRILWIIPNFRSVSANTQLPPLSPRGKLWLATQDSFDYSSVILAGIVAGASQAQGSSPEFDDGTAAYGRYLWRTFTDEAVANYFTEAFLPIVTHEDPRYYTLGRGANFLHRTAYALTRLVITRTDSGGNTFNLSEVAGNALGAGISNLYYPPQERTWSQTGQKWGIQLGIDALFNVAKEFWPDIDQRIFHGKYGSTRP